VTHRCGQNAHPKLTPEAQQFVAAETETEAATKQKERMHQFHLLLLLASLVLKPLTCYASAAWAIPIDTVPRC